MRPAPDTRESSSRAHWRQLAGWRRPKTRTACRRVREGVEFFWTSGVLAAAMSWAIVQKTSPLATGCLYVPQGSVARAPSPGLAFLIASPWLRPAVGAAAAEKPRG